MRYYSLNKQSPLADFKEATIKGQAPDKGLYFPERIPAIEPSFFKNIGNIADDDIAFRVIRPYTEGSVTDDELHRIVTETINFPIPLVQVTDTIHSLELYHGPTLAFKDIGARFMSRCLGLFSKERSEKVIVLVATSGDTGGAVANGFYGVEGVEVVILYPSGKVSPVQEKQLTTLGKNIHALEIEGSFDDCQKLVKQAFADSALTKKLFLTSANSINVARWLPQQFYYFFAYKQWKQKEQAPVICVPSGNFGNICAGMLAHISGLPVSHFIAACNANDVVPGFLQSQTYLPKKAVATISNAMDVGDPSNFVRILELFDHEFIKLKSTLDSYSISDADTKVTIRNVYQSFNYLLDPHGAVGYCALEKYLRQHPGLHGIFLETAHPVKFYDVVEPVIGSKIPVPESIKDILLKPMKRSKMGNRYEEIYNYLMGI
ncbi:MAG: threonine synthase [Chitinophagaceae bacterium]|nr:threonine synthase [Chitinophagaceae bacterium]